VVRLEPVIGRNSLVDVVVERIQTIVDQDQLQAGDRLPSEHELVDTLGVSRTVLREAIGRMEALGLVSVERGKGTFVGTQSSLLNCTRLVRSAMSITRKDLRQLAEFRAAIECQAARQAAETATPGDVEELERLCAVMDREDVPREEAIEADFRFHRKICESTQNELMLSTLEVIQEFVIEGMIKTTPHPRNHARSQQLHRRILDAIRARDPAAAGEAMQIHMDSVHQALSKAEKSEHHDLPVS
jgi:GntR family transcriptional repressor for pyruvate dehydrogenase complex